MVKFNMYLWVFLTVWSIFEVLYINIFKKLDVFLTVHHELTIY